MINSDIRAGIFVDAANVHVSANATFNRNLDYDKLLKFSVSDCRNPSNSHRLYRAIVYAVRHGDMDRWCSALHHMGYEIKVKDVTRYQNGRTKADWDIEICMDVVRMIDLIDMVVLVTGDGDVVPLVKWCQSKGKIVRIISVDNHTSRLLKDEADIYTPINDGLLLPAAVKATPRDTNATNHAPKTERATDQPNRTTGDGVNISKEEILSIEQDISEFEEKNV